MTERRKTTVRLPEEQAVFMESYCKDHFMSFNTWLCQTIKLLQDADDARQLSVKAEPRAWPKPVTQR